MPAPSKKSIKTWQSKAIDTINNTLRYAASSANADEMLAHPRWTISTGITLLDLAIGGGIKEGRILRVYGPPHVVKTTLLMQCMLEAMHVGAKNIWADPEGTLDQTRVQRLGESLGRPFNPSLLVPFEPVSVTDLFRGYYASLHQSHPIPKDCDKRPVYPEPLVLYTDTISASPTTDEVEETEESIRKKAGQKAGMSSRARIIKKEMRKMSLMLPRHGAAMVIAEQAIENIGQWGGGLTTSGGKGLKFHNSASVMVQQSSSFVGANREIAGQMVRFISDKSRFCKPGANFKVPLYFEKGINDVEGNLLFLMKHGVAGRDGRAYVVQGPSGPVPIKDSLVQSFTVPEDVKDLVKAITTEHAGKLWIVSSKSTKKSSAGEETAEDESDPDELGAADESGDGGAD